MDPSIARRTFLVASTCGWASALCGRAAAAGQPTSTGGKAKSTILFFLSGGASHVDLWDMKPKAPVEYRGTFQPIQTSAAGITLCEHLPLLAKQAHHLAVVNSVGGTVSTNDHHAGYYYNLTGHVPDPTFLSQGNNRTPYPDDWPCMGAVVAAKRPVHPRLPNFITLPQKEGAPAYTRPGQFAGRLGLEFDPLYVEGDSKAPLKFQVPSLVLQEGTPAARLTDRHALLQELDASRREFDVYAASRNWNAQQQRALSLLLSSSTTEAFDVSRELPKLRERYGETVNGMSLLAARRLVEAGVPFITVFWRGDPDKLNKKCSSGGGWDTHGNNFACLKEDLLPDFDRAFSALIEDLAQSGLLEQTLVLVTSEMGRKPKIGDPRSGGVSGAGRDHWTHCLTNLLAGGGIRGGQVYGTSDRFGEYPANLPVTPADITKTVYRAMGLANLQALDSQKRPYNLLAEGEAIAALF
jgi:uncharacterized protein (DUF1501 family)